MNSLRLLADLAALKGWAQRINGVRSFNDAFA